jgi:hypothetical protein
MNFLLKYFTATLITLIIFSCGTTQTSEDADTSETPEAVTCTYSYINDSIHVSWTAYKFTEKKGVKGTFNTVMVEGINNKAESVFDVFKNASFNIQTASVNSNDASRDQKIINHFFKIMEATDEISGKIVSISENGTTELLLSINGEERSVSGTLTATDNKVVLQVELNLDNWNGQNAIASLNKVCYDLHKGEDGKSVLWPNVSVLVETTLIKKCN